jgi:hypothetical protein
MAAGRSRVVVVIRTRCVRAAGNGGFLFRERFSGDRLSPGRANGLRLGFWRPDGIRLDFLRFHRPRLSLLRCNGLHPGFHPARIQRIP